ncbi:uncharacterized protein [Dysidea avara]|uniref:uncharacterized protein n=1 Tax=Dysidea avara TaxID=196820 RepID=UPI00332885B1
MNEVKHYITERGVKWQFTTALAPWQGGFYERLVGLVKRSLRKAMGQRRFTIDQLITILTEVEAIVNMRPLTYVYDEIYSDFTLTPAHFLMSRFQPLLLSTADSDDEEDEYCNIKDSATSLLDTWRKGQQQLNSFWQIWRNEYSSMYHRKEKNQINAAPHIGQVVIIKDEKVPRRYWKLGKIDRLFYSNDGEIRTAEIHLSGNRIIQRSIKLLYPLELTDQSKKGVTEITPKSQHAGCAEPTNNRINNRRVPMWQAATIARQMIHQSLEKNTATVLFNVK